MELSVLRFENRQDFLVWSKHDKNGFPLLHRFAQLTDFLRLSQVRQDSPHSLVALQYGSVVRFLDLS